MKTILLLTIGACFWFTACEKETFQTFPILRYSTAGETPAYKVDVFYPGDTTKGISYALKNGVHWSAGAECKRIKKGEQYFWTVVLKTVAEDNVSGREGVGIATIPEDCEGKMFIPKQYRVGKIETVGLYLRAYSDGDVFIDRYLLDTTATDNFIRIDRLDRGRNLMQGTYSLTYEIVSPRIDPSNPVRVKFSEGRFGVKLPD